jgi:hypothetical protein
VKNREFGSTCTSTYRKNKKILCEKAYEMLFLAMFAVHTGKKKDFVKKCENV